MYLFTVFIFILAILAFVMSSPSPSPSLLPLSKEHFSNSDKNFASLLAAKFNGNGNFPYIQYLQFLVKNNNKSVNLVNNQVYKKLLSIKNLKPQDVLNLM